MKIFKDIWNKIWNRNGQVQINKIKELEEIIKQLNEEIEHKELVNRRVYSDFTNLQNTYKRIEKELNKCKKDLEYQIKIKDNDAFDKMPKVKIGIHGFSVNDMYRYCEPFINKYGKLQDRVCTDEYYDWKKEFKRKMDIITNNKKNATSMFRHINLKRRIKVDVCFGVTFGYDVDNMIKSFLDTLLVEYYGLNNDNGVIEVNMRKELVETEKDGYIAFNITNI
jgi:Holliday junction resolvase RusA-like endonuclease